MRAEIIKAIRTCMPIAVGVVPLGLAFGVLMVQTGFDWWWTPIFSIVIYAGSMEFLAISMVTGGVTPAVAAVTGFMVNFRHIFYGLTFPRDEIRNRFGRAYSTYALTDESYAVLSAFPRNSQPSGVFVFTVQLFCQVLWVVSGIIGALAGQAIPPSVKGLDFALVALFIVLAIDSFQNNKDYSLPLSAAVLGVLAGCLFPGQLLMVALSAYFLLLVVRYLSPRVDSAMILRRES
ncbi:MULTISPECIES: AzlC family ABC transporter permease [Corynebacterium]|uniref:AzlC family ABC transporter permease n=1 Tax=Corynebacterium TaxID=1716 RepID=UPI0008A4FE15|nr:MULTISPECIES: AzlC family ABC transporter permease [Corynebacterium]MTD96480.1 AzlC family ABC transporter permease [Corynebacterium guaraldiae]OFL62864.1 branched-chain amino acid ABC transporter permease [Corynebacterium sp. HMSC065D07]TRX33185.1 AzlC family ABC transporter permease [Corynebacterium guaraldiae]